MAVVWGAAAWPLFLISVLSGIALAIAFRKSSDQIAISRLKKKIIAHLLEFRLFLDEPAVIWRAQVNLIRANLQLITLLIRPVLLLTIPVVLLLTQMEAIYGRAPLAIGQASLLTLQLSGPLPPDSPAPLLDAPPEIAWEQPAVRATADNQISWRIRPLRAFSGRLRLRIADTAFEKSVIAGGGPGYKSERRIRQLLSFLLQPTERPLTAGNPRWIEIRYPPAEIRWFGLRFRWFTWFTGISLVSGLFASRWASSVSP